MKKELDIRLEDVVLKGELTLSERAKGLVIFSHGSGSSRRSPRNKFVARALESKGFSSLLFDLLTEEEDLRYEERFNIDHLTHRLIEVTKWIKNREDTRELPIGYFGASTGAASAIKAAALLGDNVIKAVVSRGGRADMVDDTLIYLKSPTLLLVGALDPQVIKLNKLAFRKMRCIKRMTIIPDASHLFEEEGKLAEVTLHAINWFQQYLWRSQINIEKEFMM